MQEMQETWDRPLGQEDPLEEKMATHSSIVAGKIPWTEEPGGLQPVESQESYATEHVHYPQRALSFRKGTGRKRRREPMVKSI